MNYISIVFIRSYISHLRKFDLGLRYNRYIFVLFVGIACSLFFGNDLFSQAPQKMSYQAVMRNSTGQLLINKTVGLRISILKTTALGTTVYTETQTPTTNSNGLISIQVGGGAGFNTIDWGADSYYIKTEMDPAGGTSYSITSTTQLLSVPYALYSGSSASSMVYPGAGIPVSTGSAWATSVTDNSNNWNTAYSNRISSLTTTGNSGAATLSSNTLNIPNYTLAGLGGISLSGLSASSPLSYNSGTGAFSIQVANGSQDGYLSSANWTTFNNKVSSVTAGSSKITIGGTSTAPTVDVNTTNLGTIGLSTGTTGTDVNVSGSPANLDGTITLNIPDAGSTARGVVTTGAQTFAGVKTFSSAITAPTSSNTINGLIVNSGALSGITGLTYNSGAYNFDQSASSGTFKTGTGAVSINGDATLASGKTLTLTGLNSSLLKTNASGVVSSATAGTDYQYPITLGTTVDATNSNGATFTSNTLTMGFATGSFPGLVSTATQTFAGAKTFTSPASFSSSASDPVSITGSGLSTELGTAAFSPLVLDNTTGAIRKAPVINSLQDVLDNAIATPPGSPSLNDSYLIPSGATGAWSGQTNKLATWNGSSWTFYTPAANDKTTVLTGTNAGNVYMYNGTAWTQVVNASGTALSDLVAAKGTNTIDNKNYTQTWNWNSLTGGNNGINIKTTSTAATGGEALLNIDLSGTNATSGLTTYGMKVYNAHGGSGTNVGIYTKAYIGSLLGTQNFALQAEGSVLLNSGMANLGSTSNSFSFLQNSAKMLIGWNKSNALGEASFISNRGGSVSAAGGGFAFYDIDNSGTISTLVAMNGNGNVGIGVQTPGNKLEVNGNATTTGTVMSLSTTALTSGTGLIINGPTSGATLTGNLLNVNTATTGAFTNGGIRFNFTGAHTGNGFQIDDATSTGTVMSLSTTALTSGTGLIINGPTSGATLTGNLLNVNTASTGAFTNGGIRFNFTGAHTGNGFQIDDVTTTGIAMDINANSITSGSALDVNTSNASLASTNGFFRVSNSAAATGSNPFVRLQPNSTAGSGITLTNAGNVGIGTTTPTIRLEVNGAAINSSATSGSTSTIDFSLSNIAFTSFIGTALTLTGLKSGGAYTLILTGTTNTGTAAFTAPGFNMKYMGTVSMTSGKTHIYSFIVAGTVVYVSMATEN